MQLFLIEANVADEGYERIYARIRQDMKEGRRQLIVVPDRFTLGVEKDLCEKCFDGGYADADVVTFTRLAQKFVGKKIGRCLSKEGTVLLLNRALNRVRTMLKYYGKQYGYGFSKELFAAIASLRTSGIDGKSLEERLSNMEGVTRDKLHDAACVLGEYEKQLALQYSDTVTRLDSLIKELPSLNEVAEANFYLLGFNVYSAQQMNLIRGLLRFSHRMTLSYTTNYGDNARVFPARQAEELLSFCVAEKIDVVQEKAYRILPEPFGSLYSSVFGVGEKTCPPVGDKIRLFSAPDPLSEILCAAREIVHLTRDKGHKFRDIAVICNNKNYYTSIRDIFARCRIPCFIDESFPVSEGIILRYATYLFEAAELGREAVFQYINHPFFGITREERGAFSLYVLKYNVNYKRFFESFIHDSEGVAETVRQKLCARLSELPRDGAPGVYCDFLRNYLLSDETQKRAHEYMQSDNTRLKAGAETDKVVDLLNEIEELIEPEVLPCKEFYALFRAACADLKTTLLPRYADTVFVGNSTESRFSDVLSLFILGANDGFFPVKKGDSLIFTSFDSEMMKKNGMEVYPSASESNIFEQFVTVGLLTKAMETLYIGYATADFGMEPLTEGEGVKEIFHYAGVKPRELYAYHGLSADSAILYRAATPENLLYEFRAGTLPTDMNASAEKYLRKQGLLRGEHLLNDGFPWQGLFEQDGETYKTSVSQLETFFGCPFKHFMRYGVRARAPEDGTLRPMDLGIIIHNILEGFFKKNLDKVYGKENLSGEINLAIAVETKKKEYAYIESDPVSAHILEGVRKECRRLLAALIENMRASDFRPIGFEIGFGYRNDDNQILITVDNQQFRLCGKIDRADCWEGRVLVTDYKTGSVTPSLKDVYCGKKLQLYVYLHWFEKQGLRPTGAFYLPIRSGATATGRTYAYVGQMINDIQLYRALDNRVDNAEGEYDSPTVGFKAKQKDGAWKLNYSVNLLQQEEMEKVTRYTDSVIEQALRELTSGFAEKKPLDGECKYCDYQKMCGEIEVRKCEFKIGIVSFSPSEDEDADFSSSEDEDSEKQSDDCVKIGDDKSKTPKKASHSIGKSDYTVVGTADSNSSGKEYSETVIQKKEHTVIQKEENKESICARANNGNGNKEREKENCECQDRKFAERESENECVNKEGERRA